MPNNRPVTFFTVLFTIVPDIYCVRWQFLQCAKHPSHSKMVLALCSTHKHQKRTHSCSARTSCRVRFLFQSPDLWLNFSLNDYLEQSIIKQPRVSNLMSCHKIKKEENSSHENTFLCILLVCILHTWRSTPRFRQSTATIQFFIFTCKKTLIQSRAKLKVIPEILVSWCRLMSNIYLFGLFISTKKVER